MHGRILWVVSGVIVLVVALVLMPVVLSQVNAVVTDPNISNYPGTAQLAKLIPLMYIVGTIGLAGFLTIKGFRGQ